MQRYNYSRPDIGKMFLALIFVGFSTFLPKQNLSAQEPFTSSDALNIKSFRSTTLTDDGSHLAGIFTTARGRLNVNHKRFGDPTYIYSSNSELVILDTKTGEKYFPIKDKIQVRSLTWSPAKNQLAFFLLKSNQYFLHTFSVDNKKVKQIKLKGNSVIVPEHLKKYKPQDQ